MQLDIRKTVTVTEEMRTEVSRPVDPPIRRVIAAAVFTNPHTGEFLEDLGELSVAGAELSGQLADLAVTALGGESVHSYGKAGVVGMSGELEHVAAILHPKFGAPLREACGGGKAIIPSAKKRGGPGTPIDVPLHYKDAAFVRSHFDAVELRVTDAPSDDELLIAVAVTDGGRPFPRIGGLTIDEIVGEDGLR